MVITFYVPSKNYSPNKNNSSNVNVRLELYDAFVGTPHLILSGERTAVKINTNFRDIINIRTYIV